MNIVQAMFDERLFGPSFKGRSWGSWVVFLSAMFALEMDEEALALYRKHTGRTAPPMAPFKEAALIIGRRGGKSRILALIAVYLACFRDYSDSLATGEVATIAVIAADRRQARSIFRYINGALKSVPMLAELIERETTEEIHLSNSVVMRSQQPVFV